jgi:hypothetical protein
LAQKQSIKHDISIRNKGLVKYNAGSQRALNQKYDSTNNEVLARGTKKKIDVKRSCVKQELGAPHSA